MRVVKWTRRVTHQILWIYNQKFFLFVSRVRFTLQLFRYFTVHRQVFLFALMYSWFFLSFTDSCMLLLCEIVIKRSCFQKKQKTKSASTKKRKEICHKKNKNIDKHICSIFCCYCQICGTIFCGKTKNWKSGLEAARIFAVRSWSYLHFNKKGRKISLLFCWATLRSAPANCSPAAECW